MCVCVYYICSHDRRCNRFGMKAKIYVCSCLHVTLGCLMGVCVCGCMSDILEGNVVLVLVNIYIMFLGFVCVFVLVVVYSLFGSDVVIN